MNKGKKLYEGKAKILYETKDKDLVIQHFKDDATAFNNLKKANVEGKGVLNNRISEYILINLSQCGIKTHFIKRLNMREQLIKEVEIIPLEIIVRNFAAGSFTKRLAISEGTALPRPIVEFSLKNDSLNDPLVPEEYITAFNWASNQEIDDIVSLALRVNDFISGVLYGAKIKLIDFKIEIGRIFDDDLQRLVLADEISPDSCRLWDLTTDRKLDKDVFRQDLGDLRDAYTEVANRLGVIPKINVGSKKPTLVK